jgi:ankyrin repeat protein
MFRYLIKAGGDLDAVDAIGNTAIIWAAMMGQNRNLVELAQLGADIKVYDASMHVKES